MPLKNTKKKNNSGKKRSMRSRVATNIITVAGLTSAAALGYKLGSDVYSSRQVKNELSHAGIILNDDGSPQSIDLRYFKELGKFSKQQQEDIGNQVLDDYNAGNIPENIINLWQNPELRIGNLSSDEIHNFYMNNALKLIANTLAYYIKKPIQGWVTKPPEDFTWNTLITQTKSGGAQDDYQEAIKKLVNIILPKLDLPKITGNTGKKAMKLDQVKRILREKLFIEGTKLDYNQINTILNDSEISKAAGDATHIKVEDINKKAAIPDDYTREDNIQKWQSFFKSIWDLQRQEFLIEKGKKGKEKKGEEGEGKKGEEKKGEEKKGEEGASAPSHKHDAHDAPTGKQGKVVADGPGLDKPKEHGKGALGKPLVTAKGVPITINSGVKGKSPNDQPYLDKYKWPELVTFLNNIYQETHFINYTINTFNTILDNYNSMIKSNYPTYRKFRHRISNLIQSNII
jgi:hypothetical protein